MKLMFVGDINLGEYYTSIGNGPRSYMKSKNPLEHVLPLFKQADAVIGNLEAPLKHNIDENGSLNSLTLIGLAQNLKYLSDANFKYLQISNNHIIQHGAEVFEETLNALSIHNILALGLISQRMEFFSKDGVTVGFLSASDTPDNTDKNQKVYQILDDSFMAAVEASIQLVDHLIILLHWGSEDSTVPNERQKAIAQELKKLGVRAVIGSHTHLFYEIERADDFICAYSLGNFIFDLAWDARLLKSGILEINFNKDGFSSTVHPIDIKKNGCQPCLAAPPKDIDSKIVLYNHGKQMKHQQLKKTIYLIKNIWRGRTLLKLSFFLHKLQNIIKRK